MKIPLFICFTMALSSGCAPAPTLMHNPLTYGMSTNRSRDTDRSSEYGYNFASGTLTSEANLVRLTPEEACFLLSLRIFPDRRDLLHLEGWGIALRMDGVLLDTPPQISAQSLQITHRPGEVVRMTLRRRSGVSDFVPRQQMPKIGAEKMLLPVATVSGEICFAHRGRIDTATQDLELSLAERHATQLIARKLRFRWRFKQR